MTRPSPSTVTDEGLVDDEPQTWRELAEAAIADLRRYAEDEFPHRRLVSAGAYEKRLEALASGHTALLREIALLRDVAAAARDLPRETPAAGGSSTIHDFKIAAHAVWANDRALKALDAALCRPLAERE